MKKITILGLFLMIICFVQAQEKGSYLYLNAGGGLHEINYKLSNGNTKLGLGFTGNLGWNYFINKHFGFGIGVGFQTFNSSAILNYMTSNSAVDADGDAYDYRIYYADWQETQNLFSLDVPIGLSYQTKFNDKSGMIFTLGAKVSVPFSATYKISAGQIDTKGYYSQWNVELSGMPQHGFYSLTSMPTAKFTANTIYSVFADLGYLHSLSQNLDLYIGIYGNYGLNNLINPSTSMVYQQDGVYNGVMSSDQINKANLFSTGVKIGINFHIPSKNKIKPDNNNNVVNADTNVVVPDTNIVNADTNVVVPDTNIVNADTNVVVPDTNIVNADTNVVVPDNNIVNADTTTDIVVNEVKPEILDTAKQVSNEIKLNFKQSSDVPLNVQDDKLEELAKLLKQNPGMKILIIGHTSIEGTKQVNIEIGMQRANRVKDILVGYGAPASQISTETKYYLEPIAPNDTEENRAKNRRVQIIIK